MIFCVLHEMHNFLRIAKVVFLPLQGSFSEDLRHHAKIDHSTCYNLKKDFHKNEYCVVCCTWCVRVVYVLCVLCVYVCVCVLYCVCTVGSGNEMLCFYITSKNIKTLWTSYWVVRKLLSLVCLKNREKHNSKVLPLKSRQNSTFYERRRCWP